MLQKVVLKLSFNKIHILVTIYHFLNHKAYLSKFKDYLI